MTTEEEQFKMDNGIYGTYTIDKEGLCNVDGDVNLRYWGLREIGIPFGAVSGDFLYDYNLLKSLKNAPYYVGGFFSCHYNYLTTLEFAPKTVGKNFDCSSNKLTILEGLPKTVGGWFFCYGNQVRFIEEEVQAVCLVGGKLYV